MRTDTLSKIQLIIDANSSVGVLFERTRRQVDESLRRFSDCTSMDDPTKCGPVEIQFEKE